MSVTIANPTALSPKNIVSAKIADGADSSLVAKVTNAEPGDTDYGIVTRMVYGAEVHALGETFIVQQHGTVHGRAGFIWHIMGSRNNGWLNTTDLGDAAEYLDTSQSRINDVSTGTTYYIRSSSVNDTAGGTGARTVRIFYLDSSGLPANTTATMNGTTAVSLGSGFKYFLWAEVATVGSLTISAGNITISSAAAGAPTVAQIVEYITAGSNRSLSGRVMVPTGHTGYMIDWACHAIANTMDVRLRGEFFQDNGHTISPGVFHFMDRAFLASGTGDGRELHYAIVPADAQVKISAIPGGAPAINKLDCDFDILILANT